MPDMIDPSNSLISFQDALTNKLITLSSCTIHKEMKVLLDDAEGTLRITYALLDGQNVQGIAIYIPAEPIDGLPCFGLGYAVAEPYRNSGIATKIVQESLEEMQAGFKKHAPKFYVEAIVGVDNLGSNKIASKLLSQDPTSCNDTYSGKPAQQYVRLFE